MLPGRLILWVNYMFPKKGFTEVVKSSRHARSPIMTFIVSTVFWLIAFVVVVEDGNRPPFESTKNNRPDAQETTAGELRVQAAPATNKPEDGVTNTRIDEAASGQLQRQEGLRLQEERESQKESESYHQENKGLKDQLWLQEEAAGYHGDDPIVRQRLGIPPKK